jgi:hypothetical protein
MNRFKRLRLQLARHRSVECTPPDGPSSSRGAQLHLGTPPTRACGSVDIQTIAIGAGRPHAAGDAQAAILAVLEPAPGAAGSARADSRSSGLGWCRAAAALPKRRRPCRTAAARPG